MGVLFAALYAAGGSRRTLVAAAALGIPAVTVRLAYLATLRPELAASASALGAVFSMFMALVIGRIVLRPGKVSGQTLVGAVCVYLLLGLAWTGAYGLAAALVPGSFALPGGDAAAIGNRDGTLTYFSFVTLATLGYGDVVPVHPSVRTLAWLEAVAGQLFLAITIARLVGLHIVHAPGRDR